MKTSFMFEQEKREVRFWFKKGAPEPEAQADEYMELLLNPRKFPKGSYKLIDCYDFKV